MNGYFKKRKKTFSDRPSDEGKWSRHRAKPALDLGEGGENADQGGGEQQNLRHGHYKDRNPKPVRSAWDWGLLWLNRKDYTEKEMREKWKQKEVPDEEAQAALTRLQSAGFQSDARCLENRIRQRAQQGRGERLSKHELRNSGLDAESDAAEEGFDQYHKVGIEKARSLIGRKYKSWMNDRKERQKATHFLLRRGFSFDDVRAIMSAASIDAFDEE